MRFTDVGLRMLELFETPREIRTVGSILKVPCDIIRNNYLKSNLRHGYIERVCKATYVLSEKGRHALKKATFWSAIKKDIADLVNERQTNIRILGHIKTKYSVCLTDSSVYSIAGRLRKKNNMLRRNKIERKIPPFSNELCEFLGLVFSDGGASGYEVFFTNKDEALLNRFQVLAERLFEVKVKTRLRSTGVSDSHFSSIDVVRFIKNVTYNKTKIPNEILSHTSYAQAFLKAYFSGDGCAAISISHKRTKNKLEVLPFVALACRRRKATESVANMLKSLGCEHVLVAVDGLRIQRKADMQKFYEKVGFIDNCRIRQSKYWKGYTKNQVLKFMVTRLPDARINRLAADLRKEEVINYIRSKLCCV